MKTGLPRRIESWIPESWIPLLLFGALALAPALLALAGEAYWLSILTRILILAIAALSLDLILGFGGLVSFGHAAFLGIGAYSAGILVAAGWGDLLIVLPVALLASGVFAVLTGIVCLRTKGVAFIMITLAFGQMAFFLAQSLYAYGGDDGLTLSGRSTLAGFELLKNRVFFYYLVLVFLVAAYFSLRMLVRSRFGRALRGARDNRERLESFGFDVFRLRLIAYCLSGMLAGLAGALFANHSEFVSPSFLSWQRSGELIFMVIIGGRGTLWGPILGAALFLGLEDGLSSLTEHWKLIFGAIIVAFVLFTRGGIAQLLVGPRHG